MVKKKMSRSGMLLLELMMAILIFSLAAAVCIQVFLKAHDLSQRAQELTQAVNCCGSAAETLRSAAGPDQALSRLENLYPQLEMGDGQARAAVDGGSLNIRWSRQEGLTRYTIAWNNDKGQQIYALELVQGEGGSQ